MSVSRIYQIISLLIISSSRVFSAESVCPRKENYTVTSMETYNEPVVVNTFTWCLQVPPRCPKTRTEMRQRHRVKLEVKTRIVNECCEGYVLITNPNDGETGFKCERICPSGYRGEDCASVCPSGTWGFQCGEECRCSVNSHCNPVNGYCECLPGLRGENCTEPCSSGRWGPKCLFHCDCDDSTNLCHPEHGNCIGPRISLENVTLAVPENTQEENYEVPNFTVTEYNNEDPSKVSETIEQHATEVSENRVETTFATTDYPSKTNNPETTLTTSMDQFQIGSQNHGNEVSTTARPMIVLVSVPERRRIAETDHLKFSIKNPFVRTADDIRDIVPPQTDYVKTLRKDDIQQAPIPLDIALIVVASIVSLALTSVAVVMVLHMRSKLFENTRLSIYEEKMKSQSHDSTETGRISIGGLPQSPIRLSPIFTTSPETILTVNGIDQSSNYANGPATIGLRISGSLHDFLQGDHYDRPSATLIRLKAELNANAEHIYDEIPLQSTPLCSRKNA